MTKSNKTVRKFPAKLYKVLDKQYPGRSDFISNRNCVPIPSIPENNKQIYEVLKVNGFIILIMALSGVYFERLRSICAGSVYTIRNKERNIWLYNHILELKSIKNSFVFNENDSFRTRTLKWIYSNLGYFALNSIFVTFMNLCCCYFCCMFDRVSLKAFLLSHETKFVWLIQKIRPRNQRDKCVKCGDTYGEEDSLLACGTKNCQVYIPLIQLEIKKVSEHKYILQ